MFIVNCHMIMILKYNIHDRKHSHLNKAIKIILTMWLFTINYILHAKKLVPHPSGYVEKYKRVRLYQHRNGWWPLSILCTNFEHIMFRFSFGYML